MRVSSHQITFAPWHGFFHKLISSDIFVLNCYAKTYEYSRRSKLTHPEAGDFWFGVPITPSRAPSIETKIRHEYTGKFESWQHEKWAKVEGAYRTAPFWEQYKGKLFEILVTRKDTGLVTNNLAFILWFRDEVLECDTPLLLDYERPGANATERIMHLLDRLGATSYISGEKGPDYLDLDAVRASDVDFKVQVVRDIRGGYSVIHYLLHLGPQKTRDLIRNCGFLLNIEGYVETKRRQGC